VIVAPLEAGAVHDTDTAEPSRTAVTLVGAPGAAWSTRVTELDIVPVPVPAEFVAVTLKVYDPEGSPLKIALVELEVTTTLPGLDVTV
jgi:hypothetical protein